MGSVPIFCDCDFILEYTRQIAEGERSHVLLNICCNHDRDRNRSVGTDPNGHERFSCNFTWFIPDMFASISI